MGYSARYHAASLAAVFLALAIGILIGAEFGGGVINDTRHDLEKSLTKNLDQAHANEEDLRAELGWANDFGDQVYPALTSRQLSGMRLGLIGLGSLPGEVTKGVMRALQPTGARVVGVGVVREPPDLGDLADSLSGTRYHGLGGDPETLAAFSHEAGRQLVIGGNLLDAVRSSLFLRASGEFGSLDGMIIARLQPDGLGPAKANNTSELEDGLLGGIESTGIAAVGVETTGMEPSSVRFFAENGLSSVDDIDLTAGRLALVYALLGTEGNYGVKSGSVRLLPELLTPLPNNPLPLARSPRGGDGGSGAGPGGSSEAGGSGGRRDRSGAAGTAGSTGGNGPGDRSGG